MVESVDEFFELYAACYSDGDLQGIASLCLTPFVAVRKGEVMVMPDRGEVLEPFRRRDRRVPSGVAREKIGRLARSRPRHSVSTPHSQRSTGMRSTTAGNVVRDTSTSYQLIRTPDGWRLLSYTNHF